MYWLFATVAALLLIMGIAAAVGSILRRDHIAVVRARFAASPDVVWAVINDPLSATSWRNDVKAVNALPQRDGCQSWKEETRHGTITYVLAESTPLRSRTILIADEDLSYGGPWEYRLDPSGQGTELSITERGFVKPALFRFMARYIFGYTSTIQDYLIALGSKVGETVAPEIVASGR